MLAAVIFASSLASCSNNSENNSDALMAGALVNGAKVEITCKFYNNAPTVFTFNNNNGVFASSVTGGDAGNFQGSLTVKDDFLDFKATHWLDEDCNLEIYFYTNKNNYKYWTVHNDAYNSHSVKVNDVDITTSLTRVN